MKHPFRRVLALLLAAVLLVPLFALTASAATYDNVKCYNTVSSLGDSIATGFSMPDYDRQANGQYVIGKVKVEGSYPAIVSKAVEAKKFYPLAQPGFRTTELRVCMDPTYDGDYITEKWIRELSHAPSYTVPNLKAQRSEYAEDIRSSDLVLLDIGFNDTWLPVLGALMDLFDEKPSSASSDPTVTLAQTEAQGETDDTLSTIAFKLANGPRYAAQIYNAFAGILTTSDFQENYDAIVKRIYQLNPNATVVAVLNYNPFKDWEDVSWLAPIAQSLLYDRINAIKESYKQTYGSQYITVNVDNVEVRTTSTRIPRRPAISTSQIRSSKLFPRAEFISVPPFVRWTSGMMSGAFTMSTDISTRTIPALRARRRTPGMSKKGYWTRPGAEKSYRTAIRLPSNTER